MAEQLEGAAAAAAPVESAPAAAPPETAAASPAEFAPLVTVGVPVHDAEEFLAECLDSVLAQTLADFELICVDDGSTDGSSEILAAYAERDPRVRAVRQEAAGVSAARNRVLDLARGRYLLYLDADDWLEPVALEHLVARLEADGADIAVCSNRNYDMRTKAKSRTTNCLNRKQLPERIPFAPEENLKYLYTFGSFNVWNKMLRVAMLRERGLRFKPFRVSQDSYFCAELLLCAQSITVVDECLHYYRIGNAGSTIGGVSADILAGYRVLVEIKRMLVERGRYEGELKQCFVNKALSQSLLYLRKAATREALAEWRDFMCAQGFADLDVLGHDAAYFYSAAEYEQLQVVLASESGDDLAFALYQQMEFDRDRQRVARNRYQVEAGKLRRGKKRLAAENERIAAERDRCRDEAEALRREKELLTEENERLTAERERLEAERDRSRVEAEELQRENGRLTGERECLTAENGWLAAEKQRLEAEKQQLAAEKKQLESARDAAVRERDRARSEIERIKDSKSWKVAQGIRHTAKALHIDTSKKG